MKNQKAFVIALGIATLAACVANAQPSQTSASSSKISYPPASRGQTEDTYFGTHVLGPYQWMEDLDSPAVKEWVDAENQVTFSYLDKIPVRGWVRERLTKLWNYPKMTTPEQVAGNRIFFRKNTGLQNQSVLFVADSASATPRELLDPNKLWPDGSTALFGDEPSRDGKLLAYQLSQGGSDWVTIHVLDVETGKSLPDVVEWVKFSGVSWTADGKGFFYSRFPTPPQGKAISQQVSNHKLYYHRLGTPQSADTLVYERPDLPQWIIGGGVTEDGRYLFVFLNSGSASQNELFYVDLGDPQKPNVSGKPKELYTKNDAIYSVVGNDKDTMYLQTTLGAPKGRIVAAKLTDPDPGHWRVVVPEGQGVIDNAYLAGGKLLIHYQVIAKSELALFSTDGKPRGSVSLPTLGSVLSVSARHDSPVIYYGFTSFLYPTWVYRYNVETGKTETFFKPDVDFDPGKYEIKQVFYPSKDGTRIPMFVLARKDLVLDGSHPTVLYGYGGFDITISPTFNPILPVWLELGGVYAVASLRGGGEYGEEWHDAGKLGKKQNVFDDFAWAAKYLIGGSYTSSKKLAIDGYSNGGLLVGTSITQNPDLFGAAYAGAGVMDMLRYQKFSGGDLWVPEYGTSDDEKAFHWLRAYSPLENVKKGVCYPPTMITTADHDDRVVPSHSYQFAAQLQGDQGCANPILIRVETKTSHGYMPTDKRIAQTADIWSFLAYNLGITNPPGAKTAAAAPQ